ncbi:MAG: hypothetical protein IAF02_21435 [Anaerolineae bacterium]|nr:hypothetical protein [Anaerolineae bacterium]
MMADSPLTITLFGEFNLVSQGQQVIALNGERPITLLAYLLLHRETAVSRQHLAFTLWPDSSDNQARANLRNLFYTLRHALPDADSYLTADAMTLQWRGDADFSLDVAEFTEALAEAKTAVTPQEQIAHLETAVAYYKGDLLPGNYDDWIIPMREELRQAYLDALHQLVDLRKQAGDYRAAARTSQRLIQHDPLDETAYVQLMHLHALSGDRAGVRRVYEACLQALRRELDVAPGPATQAAYEELLRLEAPTSLPEPAPLISPIRPSPLPVPATSFIGREAELAQIAERLADPACRLLTIVGPGGMGKTRLALQTAVGHQPVFADGVTWVGLNELHTPEQLVSALAESLNYRLRGAASAETELFPLLAGKVLLIVLDNFEHLLPAADFLTRLLAETTAVKLLITSRQALELPEEWRFDLDALPLPDEETVTLADNSAMQLFIQSGRRAANAFTPTAADYPDIAHICQLVGGMPLGIELAASWLRLLSCAEIAQEIEKSLDFLTVSLRQLPPRHRSLRAVFDYSWNLLTPEEQEILLRLSIFQGGFTREAAAQVAGADLPHLLALVDRSLVQRTAVGRYSLHNIIRQYAADQQKSDPATDRHMAQQHGRYYLQWLADQDAILRGARQKEGLTAVASDLANIRAAWQWAAAHQQAELLRGAAFPLFYFYEIRGMLSEGEAAFALAADSLPPQAEALDRESRQAACALRIYQGYLAFRQGKVTFAETMLRTTLAELQTLADDSLLNEALFYVGILDWSLGRFDSAADGMERCLTYAIQQQDAWEIVAAQVYLGLIRHDQGQLTDAHRQLTAVQAAAQQLGESRLIANALLISGRVNLLLGNLSDAEKQLADCIAMARESRDANSLAYATLYLGMVKQAQGDLAAARQIMTQSLALYADFNDMVGLERAWVMMGFLEIVAENWGAAQTHFSAFLQVKQRTHSIRYRLAAVVGTAVVQSKVGDKRLALSWIYTVLQHPALDWESKQRADTLRTQLEDDLAADQLAWAQQRAVDHPFDAVLADLTKQ